MGLVVGTDEGAEAKMESSRGNREVIRRNKAAFAAEGREQVGSALGDLRAKGDDRDSREEGTDLGAAAGGASWCIRQADADQEFRIHDRRKHYRLLGGRRESFISCTR